MLTELHVSNFAIIDRIHVQFQQGLNILSGETGAGKSVLLKSLALLMGEKASSVDIKTGADQAVIEGSFDLGDRPDIRQNLHEMGIDTEDDRLVVRRTLSAGGKSKIYLNDSLSALNSLRDLIAPLITVTGQSAPLIEMTGQHDNRHLQSKSYHLEILDRFAGLWPERSHFTLRFAELARLRREIYNLQEDVRAREQRLDFLRFQSEELEALNIQPGEDEELIARIKRFKYLVKLRTFYQETGLALDEGENSLLDQVRTISVRASEMANFDDSLPRRLAGLEQARALIEDCGFEVRAALKELETEPDDLEALEARYSQFRKLQKKYGETAEHMITALAAVRADIAAVEGSDERLENLRKSEGAMALEMKALATKLHRARKAAAREFTSLVNEELRDLNMKGLEMEVVMTELGEFTSHGASDAELMIRVSKKDEPRPLAKYASGGELSRILLSLKQIVGNSDLPRTYLFDEVDTGVSGVTAEKVGRKLKSIAQGQQVICITHLSQVAVFADVHYLIEKQQTDKKGVEMVVRRLGKKQRVEEIARLISGEKITRASLTHAREMLRVPGPVPRSTASTSRASARKEGGQ